eukprot:5244476-Alexandrium_andersonii.AAC.1
MKDGAAEMPPVVQGRQWSLPAAMPGAPVPEGALASPTSTSSYGASTTAPFFAGVLQFHVFRHAADA